MPSRFAPQARTVALIRQLSAVSLPRRKRLPRQLQPDTIRLEYFNAIRFVCVRAREAFEKVQPEILRLLKERRRELGKMDAGGGKGRALALVDRAAAEAADAFAPTALHAIAKKFGERTNEFQKKEFDKQVRAAMGVSFSSIEKPVRDQVEEFAALNVDLIRTVPERYFDRLRLDVEGAYESGTNIDDLTDQFIDRFDMSENDARRIARDQIGKLNGQVNQERQESLGVTGFVWRTVHDQRVREEHADLDGQSFQWDDLPLDEKTGEEISPGSPICCRCFAEPDFQPMLNRSKKLDTWTCPCA